MVIQLAVLGSDVINLTNTNGTVQDPEHFYGSVGTYSVTQIVTNIYGCIDQITSAVNGSSGTDIIRAQFFFA